VPVSLELEPGLPTLPCDRERLIQTLRHMTASALRVVPEGGSVVIVANKDAGGGVRMQVIAKRSPAPGSRRIVSEPPKPAMALAKGLIELHGTALAAAADGDALTLSFTLGRGAGGTL